jgi:hypothetical protein
MVAGGADQVAVSLNEPKLFLLSQKFDICWAVSTRSLQGKLMSLPALCSKLFGRKGPETKLR